MIVEVKNLSKKYRKLSVLNNISFALNEGQIVALVGPNGSGKSTLLNIITNLEQADYGTVTLCGKDHKDSKVFKEVGYMQDNSVLYDYLTGYDHLQFICQVQQLPKERIIEVSKEVGNEAYLHKKVKHYSLGMKQHLLLAMAVINRPKLLILDEPLNALDPSSAFRVRHLLRKYQDEGMTILLSSHNLNEIDQLTSNVLFVKNGQILRETLTVKESYSLRTSDNVQATHILNEQQYEVITNEQAFTVSKQGLIVDELFTLLQQHDIRILQIERIRLGTEDRYKAIFEGADV